MLAQRPIRPSARGFLALVPLLLAACGSDAFAPDAAQASAESAAVALAPARAASARTVDLGDCDSLAAPAGHRIAFRAYARGYQVYQWNGTTWAFNGPSATLYADAGGHGVVGSHYGGPTWESNSGSYVVAAVSKRCNVAPSDIPWLLLAATRTEGPGMFHRVSYIQRISTAGGQAPAGGGAVGEVRNVPYTAEYVFYRAD